MVVLKQLRFRQKFNMDYKFIESSKGGQILIVSNYLFNINKRIGTVRYWSCMGRRSHSYRVTTQTKDNILTNVSDIDLHTHPNDAVEFFF